MGVFIDSFFLKILDMSFMASWLMIAVILLRFALKKAPKWIVCMLWILVGVRLICPISVESAWSLIPSSEPVSELIRSGIDSSGSDMSESGIPGRDMFGTDTFAPDMPEGSRSEDGTSDMDRFQVNPADMNETGTITPGVDIPVIDANELESANPNYMDIDSTDGQSDLSQTGKLDNSPTGNQGDRLYDPLAEFQTGDSGDITSPVTSPVSIVNTLGIVWITGVALMLLYGFISYYRLHTMTAVSMEISAENTVGANTGAGKNAEKDMNANAGTGKTIGAGATIDNKVFQCDAIDTPFILGIIRPRIYLPSHMEDSWTDYVIAHEKTHIRRRDHWWKPLGFLILSVYWFNPLCWLSYILLCKDIELACDEAVIKTMDSDSKKIYAKALLSCSVKQKMITACPLAFGEVGIKERIRGVMNYKKPAFWIVAVSLIACIVVAVCFLTDPRALADKEEVNETDASNFEYFYDEELDGIVITGYIGEDTEVTVPKMIGNSYVVEIGEDAFDRCSILTDIIIPDSVTKIGARAFNQCENLKNVSLSEGLTAIGDYAFNLCNSLTEIRIPGSVTDIGDHTLNHCDNLTDIAIHGDLIKFELEDKEREPGTGAGGIMDFRLGDNTRHDGIFREQTAILYGCRSIRNVTVLEGTTTIYKDTFQYCGDLTSVTIPDTVTRIGDYAFYYCTSLTEIKIPGSITFIGNNAFDHCSNLTTIEFPERVDSGDLRFADRVFTRCISLKEVILPDGVTSLGMGTFADCDSLKSVIIQGSVTVVKASVFEGCESLSEVVLPDSITYIDEYAFKDCTDLASINIPDGVTGIGVRAFAGCTSLPEIILPNSVTFVDIRAFAGCTSLADIVIPDSVTRIGEHAFSKCTSLTEITIPDSITVIGESTFYGCTGLTDVTLPDSITTIGRGAFYECESLKSITIPDSVTFMDVYAFAGCTSMTEIIIPDSIDYIPDYTFTGCSSLTDVTIPGSVKAIGEGAFWDCAALTDLVINDGVISIDEGAFYLCDSLTNVTLPDSILMINDYAFSHCENLTDVYIPDGILTVVNNVFDGCDNLTVDYGGRKFSSARLDDLYKMFDFYYIYHLDRDILELDRYHGTDAVVQIPELDGNIPLTVIGVNAFCGNDSITEVSVPESVREIHDRAFVRCSNLSNINIPENLTYIGAEAFWGCSALTRLSLPDSVTFIGEHAFYGCDDITVLYMGQEYDTYY